MFDRQRPGRNVGVIRPTLPTARLEGRGGRQHRVLLVLSALHGAFHVGNLGIRHDLDRRIVGHQRKVAVDRCTAGGHFVAYVGQCLCVFFADGYLHQGIGLGHRFLGDTVKDRADAGLAVQHFPVAAGMVEREIDDTKMVAPASGHYGSNAIDGAARCIHFGIAGKGRAGKLGMGMAEQDRVNADNLCQPRHGVFGELPYLPLLEPRMRDHHHQLRALGAHLRHVFSGHLDHIAHHHAAFQIGFVPLHDLRRYQADHPDFQCVELTLGVLELPLKQHIRRKGVFGTGAVFVAVVQVDVGVDIRKIGPLDCAAQERQAEVELVVAQIGGVVR